MPKLLQDCEAKLVLLLARQRLTPTGADRAVALAQGIRREDRFFSLCVYQKVYPLVLNSMLLALPTGASEFLDQAQAQLLRLLEYRWRPYFLRVQATLVATRQALNEARVPFAILRGLALAETCYPAPYLRVCADVDVLIQPQHRARAEEALRGIGCVPSKPALLQWARNTREGQAELRYVPQRVLVDLNWRLTGNLGMGLVEQNVEGLFERATAIKGLEYRLSLEDYLVHLIRHVGHGHSFLHGVMQCCADVSALLAHHTTLPNAQRVHSLAQEAQCVRCLRYFAKFYDVYYRDERMPSLQESLDVRSLSKPSWEAHAYAALVIWGLVTRESTGDPRPRPVAALLCFFGKFWAIDRLPRLFIMASKAIWMPAPELVILKVAENSERLRDYRLAYYVKYFAPALALITLATPVRLISGMVSLIARLWPRRACQGAARL